MPKKFGDNTKAAEAKARKNAIKDEETRRKQQQLEDELWKEDDRHVLKKLQRKEDKDKKKTDQVEKKKELQRLAEEEMAELSKISAKPVPVKITRIQIETHKENAAKEIAKAKTPEEEQIPENVNRITFEGDVASTVDEAISVLKGLSSSDAEIDLHPEKRMKAAYIAYETERLPVVKAENPNLRLSQLKQMLRKDWLKSPSNPLNQAMKSSALK